MNQKVCIFTLLVLLISGAKAAAQSGLSISIPTGLKVMAVQEDFPLLKLLLPGQSISERGIEIEFPEHVTGVNEKTNKVEHLYLVTNGNANKRKLPGWRVDANALIYETEFDNKVRMVATAYLESNGLRYTYKFINLSNIISEFSSSNLR